MISPSMIGSIKVVFLKQLCDEDFPEKGMMAWLTDINWVPVYDCYRDRAESPVVHGGDG